MRSCNPAARTTKQILASHADMVDNFYVQFFESLYQCEICQMDTSRFEAQLQLEPHHPKVVATHLRLAHYTY
jgi:hypothetical protein